VTGVATVVVLDGAVGALVHAVRASEAKRLRKMAFAGRVIISEVDG
jgi:hypothetical protein